MLKTWLSGKLFVKKNSYRKEKEKEKKKNSHFEFAFLSWTGKEKESTLIRRSENDRSDGCALSKILVIPNRPPISS